jgi:hypothetical protein
MDSFVSYHNKTENNSRKHSEEEIDESVNLSDHDHHLE